MKAIAKHVNVGYFPIFVIGIEVFDYPSAVHWAQGSRAGPFTKIAVERHLALAVR